MGTYYFIVNETKHVYLDEMHKLSEMSADWELWNEFVRLMTNEWCADIIAIIPDFDEEAENLGYKPMKIPRPKYASPKWYFCLGCNEIVRITDGWPGKDMGVNCDNCGSVKVIEIKNQRLVKTEEAKK